MAAFVHVTVPQEGETSVHTHPGPELIYQALRQDRVSERDNRLHRDRPRRRRRDPSRRAGAEAEPLRKGRRIPFMVPGGHLRAVRLSGTVCRACHQRGERSRWSRGEPGSLASAAPSAVATTLAPGAPTRPSTGPRGLNGRPPAMGTTAWIEIELPSRTHVTSIGFWTRTMGSSAQILSFRVVTDGGGVHGPFEVSPNPPKDGLWDSP